MKNNWPTLLIIGLTSILLTGCQSMVSPIGGNFNDNIEEAKKELSPATKELIEKVFSAYDFENGECLVDFHVHAVGMGQHKGQTWVNPNMTSLMHPMNYIKYNVYKSAGGIKHDDKADDEYIKRLVRLHRAEPRLGRLTLFAFDYFHDKDGKAKPENSTFYVANDYVIDIAKKYPDIFIPVGSVHPYRKDALQELERIAAAGVRFIKWLPNAQHIDPTSKKAQEFYKVMKKYGMTLISHTGHEKAVHGEEYQKLGNPLRFRTPLEMGVKVIMAHLSSLGGCKDYENGDKEVACFDLFWRVMQDKKYEGLAFGEVSASTLYTRIGKPINTVLEHPEFKNRLVNGSDYPLPGINLLYRTGQYEDLGYITEKERTALNEIYKYNPLLFDLISKMILKHPKTGKALPREVFTNQGLLACNPNNESNKK